MIRLPLRSVSGYILSRRIASFCFIGSLIGAVSFSDALFLSVTARIPINLSGCSWCSGSRPAHWLWIRYSWIRYSWISQRGQLDYRLEWGWLVRPVSDGYVSDGDERPGNKQKTLAMGIVSVNELRWWISPNPHLHRVRDWFLHLCLQGGKNLRG